MWQAIVLRSKSNQRPINLLWNESEVKFPPTQIRACPVKLSIDVVDCQYSRNKWITQDKPEINLRDDSRLCSFPTFHTTSESANIL